MADAMVPAPLSSGVYPWQQSQWQQLQPLLEADRLPHALLLAGPPGVGKRRFARALAQALRCEKPLSGGHGCGECRSCRLLAAGSHPDQALVTPEEGARQIKVDQARRTIAFVAKTGQSGGRKVVIIEPAEAMNTNAANALLKCIEEPSGDTLLLLVSDAPSRLLPTIRSRCQRIAFTLPPREQARAWLQPMVGEAATADTLLDAVGDQPLTAMQWFEDGLLGWHQAMAKDFERLLAGELDATALAERWREHNIDAVLSWMQQHLAARIKRAAPNPAAAKGLFLAADRVGKLLAQLRSGANPSQPLALEALLLTCCDRVQPESV